MTLTLRLCEDAQEWDAALEGFEHATLFHTSDWLRFQENVSGMALRLCLFERDGRCVGLFPAFLGRKAHMRLVASPPYRTCTPRLGPLAESDEALGDVLEALEKWYAEIRADYVDIYLAREVPAEQLQSFHYVPELRHTYFLDLSDGEEAVFGRFKRVCRKAVRKATKSGITIIEASLSEHIERYYEMARVVYSRTNQEPPLSRETLLAMEAALEAGGRCRTLWAVHEEKLVACCIFGTYRDTVYSIDAVADRDYVRMAPNNLLHWELIRWAIAQGLSTYDMVGANTPNIARFKATFGPELISYSYAWKARSLRARVGRATFKAFSPMLRVIRHKVGRLLGGGQARE